MERPDLDAIDRMFTFGAGDMTYYIPLLTRWIRHLELRLKQAEIDRAITVSAEQVGK